MVVKTQRSDVAEAGVSEAVRPPAAALVRAKWRGQGWNVDLEALEKEMCVGVGGGPEGVIAGVKSHCLGIKCQQGDGQVRGVYVHVAKARIYRPLAAVCVWESKLYYLVL